MDIFTKLRGKVFCNHSLPTGDQGERLCCTELGRVTDRAAWGSGGAQCVRLSVESIEPATPARGGRRAASPRRANGSVFLNGPVTHSVNQGCIRITAIGENN